MDDKVLYFYWIPKEIVDETFYALYMRNLVNNSIATTIADIAQELGINFKYLEVKIKEYKGYLYGDPNYPNISPSAYFLTETETQKFYVEVIKPILVTNKIKYQ